MAKRGTLLVERRQFVFVDVDIFSTNLLKDKKEVQPSKLLIHLMKKKTRTDVVIFKRLVSPNIVLSSVKNKK